jgi:hypothetical protein
MLINAPFDNKRYQLLAALTVLIQMSVDAIHSIER